MNDIDFIKKCCEYADGFYIDGDLIVYPDMSNEPLKDFVYYSAKGVKNAERIIYPLLLQRAIEGVNRGDGYLIFQSFSEIRIEHNENHSFEEYYLFENYSSVDQAKRKALECVFSQEEQI